MSTREKEPELFPLNIPNDQKIGLNSVTLTGDNAGWIRWVAKAVSEEEERFVINAVYAEEIDGDLVLLATDGMRVHELTIPTNPETVGLDGLGAGWWTPVVLAKSRCVLQAVPAPGKFPDARRLFEVEGVRKTREVVSRVSLAKLILETGRCLNLDFLQEAVGMDRGGVAYKAEDLVVDVFAKDVPEDPVVFQFATTEVSCRAVVMPMRNYS